LIHLSESSITTIFCDERDGRRRLFLTVYCGDDPDLVPENLRTVVKRHGWTVQPMGRDGETVTVVVSEDGV
jgi:hypothetical protein